MYAMVCRRPTGSIRVENEGVPMFEHRNDAILLSTRAAICGPQLPPYHPRMRGTWAARDVIQHGTRAHASSSSLGVS
jgi:hypothetical protein